MKEYFNENAVILWIGNSLIDGGRIAVVATCLKEPSDNEKTGDMIQIMIIRLEESPTYAHEHDLDISICGNCPFRKNADGKRTCYVNIGQSINSTWRSLHAGNIKTLEEYPEAMQYLWKKPIRVGTYGDPAAFPPEVLIPILAKSPKGFTGYTHQWREPYAQEWKGFLQASVETEEDARLANEMGWKYYRVLLPNEKLLEGEHMCLSEVGKQCCDCRLCNGHFANICIEVHGAGKGNYETIRKGN